MSDTYTRDLDPPSLDDPAEPGCCTPCEGWGLGGPASGPDTRGRCWECRGTGHPHDGPCAEAEPDPFACETCGAPGVVVEESDETGGFEERERQYHVVRLACGHEIATAKARSS